VKNKHSQWRLCSRDTDARLEKSILAIDSSLKIAHKLFARVLRLVDRMATSSDAVNDHLCAARVKALHVVLTLGQRA
jgi:hypothetical protein